MIRADGAPLRHRAPPWSALKNSRAGRQGAGRSASGATRRLAREAYATVWSVPIVTLAVLCKEIRQDEEQGTNIIGVLEGLIALDEGPTDVGLTGFVRVYAATAGVYPFRAVIVAPSGRIVSSHLQ